MLYITYFSKLKYIPENANKQIITRFPPKWLNVKDYKNIYINKSLSPSPEILLDYKENNDWEKYTEKFNEEMINREDLVDMLTKMENYLKAGKDVYLLCYEKDYTKCHRYLIAKYLKTKEVKWEEFNETKLSNPLIEI